MTETIYTRTKTGFFRFAIIKNAQEYVKVINDLADREVIMPCLNQNVDAVLDSNGVHYFSDSLEICNRSDPEATFAMIDTGYTTPEGKKIYGGFFECGTFFDAHKWNGVEIGTESDLRQKFSTAIRNDTLRANVFFHDLSSAQAQYERLTANVREMDNFDEFVSAQYQKASQSNNLYVYQSNLGKKVMYFSADSQTADGENIWFTTEPNGKTCYRQKWFGIKVEIESSLRRRILDMAKLHIGNVVFDNTSDMGLFLKQLNDKARHENWSSDATSRFPYSRLKSYLDSTYARLVAESRETGKEKIVRKSGKVFFNTNLLDNLSRALFVVGKDSLLELNAPGLDVYFNVVTNAEIFSENDREIADYFSPDELPDIARYFTGGTAPVFDSLLDIRINDTHIFFDGLKNGRLPSFLPEYNDCRDSREMVERLTNRIASEFDTAIKRTLRWAERNFNFVVPQYAKDKNEIQFLFPIFFKSVDDPSSPECVLALQLIDAGDRKYYRGTTILTTEMAYNNARQIAKPGVFWLTKFSEA